MPRTGRPPAPLLELTAKQEEFYAYVVDELLNGDMTKLPRTRLEAFKAGVAMSRQYAGFSRARRKS